MFTTVAMDSGSRRRGPDSEVRKSLRRVLMQTSESKGHQQMYGYVADFGFEVPMRVWLLDFKNFKSTALTRLGRNDNWRG
jgi:hypothetical protein